LAILRRNEPAAKALKSVGEELLGSVGIAENGVGCIDFASDLVGFDTVLVKVATLALLALGGLLPGLVEAARIRRLQSKLELHRPSLAAQQHVVDDGLDDLLRFDWNRHRDAEVVPNLLCLADEHFEDDPVHGIVRAVEQDRLHDRLRLAKPVDPALTLLQPVRIPGQVVMNHGVKIVLKIDALAQAIGGDEYSWITLHQFRDALLPLLIVIFAGDGGDGDLLEVIRERVLQVVRRLNETAEDDRQTPFGEECLQNFDQPRQLAVGGWPTKVAGPIPVAQESTLFGIAPGGADVLQRRCRRVVRRLFLSKCIQPLRPVSAVDLVATLVHRHRIGHSVDARTQHGRSRRGAR
jgi:hypothetical protein